MPTNQPTPTGYFNATEKLNSVKFSNKVKVSQFLDNKTIQELLSTLDTPFISSAGRYGYTFLRDELMLEYENWLDNVGGGR